MSKLSNTILSRKSYCEQIISNFWYC